VKSARPIKFHTKLIGTVTFFQFAPFYDCQIPIPLLTNRILGGDGCFLRAESGGPKLPLARFKRTQFIAASSFRHGGQNHKEALF